MCDAHGSCHPIDGSSEIAEACTSFCECDVACIELQRCPCGILPRLESASGDHSPPQGADGFRIR